VLSVPHRAGRHAGDAMAGDSRVRKISFTGSTARGERITRTARGQRLSSVGIDGIAEGNGRRQVR
jgi:acyl-CoA reductase-like NAD-dependent aldehyde dehydrogenase